MESPAVPTPEPEDADVSQTVLHKRANKRDQTKNTRTDTKKYFCLSAVSVKFQNKETKHDVDLWDHFAVNASSQNFPSRKKSSLRTETAPGISRIQF